MSVPLLLPLLASPHEYNPQAFTRRAQDMVHFWNAQRSLIHSDPTPPMPRLILALLRELKRQTWLFGWQGSWWAS